MTMHTIRRTAAWVALVLATTGAAAQGVHRCVDPATGRTEFRGTPCTGEARPASAAAAATTASTPAARAPRSSLDAPMSVRFASVSLKDILKLVGDYTQHSVAIDPDVDAQAQAAVEFHRVPAGQALQQLAAIYHVRIEADARVIRASKAP